MAFAHEKAKRAQYSVIVLKVPLNPNQAINLFAHGTVFQLTFELKTKRTDDYRIGIATDTECIVSNRIDCCCIGENPILRASLQVRQLLAGRITQDDQRRLCPVTRRTRAV